MSKIRRYITEVLNEINSEFLVFVRVDGKVSTDKEHFRRILSSISDFTSKAKGVMKNARKRGMEWTYVASFPDVGKQKRFMDELKNLHPELEIKIPEINDVEK